MINEDIEEDSEEDIEEIQELEDNQDLIEQVAEEEKPKKPKAKKTNTEEKIWEFKCYGSLLKKMINRVGVMNNEIKIDVDEKGISTKTVDPTHVAMVYLSIPRKDFYTGDTAVNKTVAYNLKEPFSFAIDLDRLDQTLKLFTQYSTVTGYIKNNRLFLEGDDVQKKISLLDAETIEQMKMPEMEQAISTKIDNLDLLIKGMEDPSIDCLKLVADKKGTIAVMENEDDELTINLSTTSNMNTAKSLYSTDYFSKIIKGIGNRTAVFEFSTDKPIKITSNVYDTGQVVVYLLAPRIEEYNEG